MDNEFKKLTKTNLPSGSMDSGKIIKGIKVSVGSSSRIISNESTKVKTSSIPESESIEKNENLFTIEPKFNDDVIEELNVSCSCGNYTRIVFNKDEEPSEVEIEENPVEEESLSEE